jgi:hypothetical protein
MKTLRTALCKERFLPLGMTTMNCDFAEAQLLLRPWTQPYLNDMLFVAN